MEINSFEEATVVIISINSILALRNHKYPANKLKLLFVWLYNILILCFVIMSLIYHDVWNMKKLSGNPFRMTYMFISFVFTVTYLCTIILGWHYSKATSTLRTKIAEVDESLRKLGSSIDYRNFLYRVIELGIVIVIYFVVFLGLYFYRLQEQISRFMVLIVTFSFGFILNLDTIILYDFVTYVYWLELKFKQTNDLLKMLHADNRRIWIRELNTARNRRSQFLKIFNTYATEFHFQRSQTAPSESPESTVNKIEFLKDIRFVHLQLYDIIKMVNKVFKAQLMIQTTNIVIYITMTLYFTYAKIKSPADYSNNSTLLFIHFIELSSNIGKIILACYICERAAREANKVRDIIHSVSVHEFDKEMKDEVRITEDSN
ncbi:uncharacterized protein LOC122396988 [Colletes gigas]|uniref:uncharacterized protein LOC122396988 n=1 Tax=Colletes gigas TaxID=935657 RepID=UPI001C9B8302|nr:uncharacterized protein LOC122396988 [Colletes gigas]